MKKMEKNQKKILIFITLLSLLSSLQAQDLFLYLEEFSDQYFSEASKNTWKDNKSYDIVTKCGNKSLVGGYKKLGKDTQLKRSISNLPSHTKIKVSLNVYLLDNMELADELYVYVDGKKQQTITQTSRGNNICGHSTGDQKHYIELVLDHSSTNLSIELKSNYSAPPTDESWGFRDFQLHLDNQKCLKENEQRVGNLCITKSQLTSCSTSLKSIRGNIESECKYDASKGDPRYNFTISYKPPYTHNPACFTQQLFANTIVPIPEGTKETNEFSFIEKEQIINFSLKHDELENKLKCTKITSGTKIDWKCDFDLQILLGGKLQHSFKFHFESSLDTKLSKLLSLNVKNDEQQGKCCINELEVDTEVKFCTDITCSSYLPQPYTAIRNQEIFIEHSIVSPEWKNLYLHPEDIFIFGAKAEILDFTSTQGKTIYKTSSYLAFDNMLVEVISILGETAPKKLLRFLQEEKEGFSLRENYDIKAISQISIKPEPEAQPGTEQEPGDEVKKAEQGEKKLEEREDDKVETLQYALVGVCSFVGLVVFAGLGLYCYRKKQSRQSMYQE